MSKLQRQHQQHQQNLIELRRALAKLQDVPPVPLQEIIAASEHYPALSVWLRAAAETLKCSRDAAKE